MRKRLLALCLAAALLLGMLPTFALPITADASMPTHRAAYGTGIAVDGQAKETPWYISGKIGANAKFGAIWGDGMVYLAVQPGKEETVSVKFAAGTLTVTKAGGASGLTGAVAAWGSDTVEIAVPLSSLNITLRNYNETLPVQIKVGNANWNGNLILSNMFRDKVDLTPAKSTGADANNISLTEDANNFVYSNKYIPGCKNYNESTFMCGYQYLEDRGNNTLVLDFDFTAVKMPSYGTASSLSKKLTDTYAYYGYAFMHGDTDGMGYSVAITNTDSGLFLCVNDAEGEEFKAVKMNKKVGDTFHMRFEKDANQTLYVYVDDVLLVKFADAMADANGWGRTKSILNTNLYAGSKYSLGANGRHDMEIKVENMTAGYWDDSLLTTLTFDDIKGANKTENSVDSKLNLFTAWTNPVLNAEYALSWESSNTDVIKPDGTVIRQETDQKVTITAKLGTVATKSFTLIVPKKAVNAYFTTEEMKVDGRLNEASWEHAKLSSFAAIGGTGAPTGSVRALMYRGVAYFAVDYTDATSLKMVLGNKEWTIDLTKASFEAEGVEASIRNGTVEMEVDMKAVGLQVKDYNTEYAFQLTLTNGNMTSSLEAVPTVLIFEGKKVNVIPSQGGNTEEEGEVTNIDLNFTTKGHFKFDAATGILNGNFTTTTNRYYIETNAERMAMVNKRRNMLLEQVLRIDSMPAGSGDFTAFDAGAGYRIMLEQGEETLVSVLIYKDADGKLQLKVWQDGTKKASDPIALGVGLGEEFILGLLRENDGHLSVYVNGMLLQRLETSVSGSVKGANGLYLYYKDSACSKTDPCSIAIFEMTMTVSGEEAGADAPADGPVSATLDLTKGHDPQSWLANGIIDKTFDNITSLRYYVSTVTQDSQLEIVDQTKDVLMEMENFWIGEMPISAGNYTAPNDCNNGLCIMLEEGNTIIIAALVYNTDAGLKIKIWTGKIPAEFALGKATGDTFKLGLLRKPDGSVTVLVDDNEVGCAATKFTKSNQGKSAIDFLYNDTTNCSTDTPFKLKTTAVKLTVKPSDVIVEEEESDGKARLDLSAGLDPQGWENGGTIEKGFGDITTTQYYVITKAQDDQLGIVNKNKEMLMELEEFRIGAMPVGNGNFAEPTDASGGLTVLLEIGSTILVSGLIYNTEAGLRIKIWTGSTPADYALGKKTGDTFKLGLNRKPDGTVTVLVDGTEIGSTATNFVKVNQGKNAVCLYYGDSEGCSAANPCMVTLSNIALSVEGASAGPAVPDDTPANSILLDLSKALDPQHWQSSGAIDKSLGKLSSKAYYVMTDAQNPQLRAINTECDVLLKLYMTIYEMPVSTGIFNNAADGEGFHIIVEEGDTVINSVLIYNSGNGLYAKIWNGDIPTEVALGVQLGESFNLGIMREFGNIAKLLVNGTEVASVKCDYKKENQKKNAINLYYNDRNCSAEDSFHVEVATMKLAVTPSSKNAVVNIPALKDEMASYVLLPDADLANLTQKLSLPSTFDSQYLGLLDLVWTSSRTDVLTLEGQPIRPDTKTDAYSVLAVKVAGGKEVWSEEVRVPTTYVKQEQTPSHIMITYTSKFTENWTFNNKILSNMKVNGSVLTGKQAGIFGAKWNMTYLFFAVKTGGQNLGITVNGKTVALTGDNSYVKGNTTYVAVSYSSVGLVAPNTYNKKVSATITLGDAKWEGTMQLTSNETFLVDDVDSDLPGNGTRGTTYMKGGVEEPNRTTQLHRKTATGWQLQDYYEHNGVNPNLIRSYIVQWGRYWGQTVEEQYMPLDDRSRTTWLEFDFYAAAMPVYKDGAESADWSSCHASYGFSWSMAAKNGRGVAMGIYNTVDGLKLTVLQADTTVPLNKYVGDTFRIGCSWNLDGSLTVYIDGEQFLHVEEAETVIEGYGGRSFMMDLIRNKYHAESSYDNFDIYVDNFTLAKGYGEDRLGTLTEEYILASNTDEYEVSKKLKLPQELENPQTDWETELIWTSSDEDVINPETGKVTAPRGHGKLVTLTVTDGLVKREYKFYVPAKSYNGKVLSVENDLDTANGKAEAKDFYQFALDSTNNSIVIDQEKSQKINYITLIDSDEYNRLDPDLLTIWTSDDNVTYNKMDRGFKMLQVGNKVYLYDFTAQGQYIKVHCTFFDDDEDEISFTGNIDEMIEVGYSNVFGAEGDFAVEKTVPVKNYKNYKSYDEIYKISLSSAGVKAGTEKSIRVYMGKQMLYHYVEGGNIVVRIPEIKAGGTVDLRIISGNSTAMDISNKEYVHEVIYGTREARKTNGRMWICSLPDGRMIGVGYDVAPEWEGVDFSLATNEVKARRFMIFYCYSEDGGLTWSDRIRIEEKYSKELGESDGTEEWMNYVGGITYDPDAGQLGKGRLILTGFYYISFDAKNMYSSDSKQRFMYSDDLGETWFRCEEAKIEGPYHPYCCSYSDVVRVSSFDGEGPNVDYVLAAQTQVDNNGSFCGRVFYSTDGGMNWTMGPDILQLEGEGVTSLESGFSEGFIMERESDHALVLYARNQYGNTNKYARAFSYDFGKTWKHIEESTTYAATNQPILQQFGENALLCWQGHHALGAQSYWNSPLNVGVFSDDLLTVSCIQDLYTRYYFSGQKMSTYWKVTNQSMDSAGDSMTITWWSNHGDPLMKIDDFTNALYRSKGAYDSFENAEGKYEGWAVTNGFIPVTDEVGGRDGKHSLKFVAGTNAQRSIRYMQDGTVSFSVYVADASKATFHFELEAAYSDIYGTAAPIGFRAENGVVTYLGSNTASGVQLKNGWNDFSFTVSLSNKSNAKATLSINGSTPAAVPVNVAVGNYICSLNFESEKGTSYLDKVVVTDTTYVDVPAEPEEPNRCLIEHKLVKTEGIRPTVTLGGRRAYFTCSVCGRQFLDSKGTEPLKSVLDLFVDKLGNHISNDDPTQPTDPSVDVTPEEDGVNVVLIVVLATLLAAAIAAGGVILYRKKFKKEDAPSA